MEKFTVKNIIDATNGYLIIGDKNQVVKDIVIDSRNAFLETAFVAIKGENLDGHNFLQSAYDNGCRIFIVSDEEKFDLSNSDSTVIKVEDTQLYMGYIAKYYKEMFKIPFIGVTGSVGKTTTRDMVFSALSGKYNALKNVGNLNNHLGVPLTLFNLNSNHECAVIEMGMSHFGEIEYLADMVKPKVAVISNIGLSHIENLGSQEGVLKAKMEITKNFSSENTLIINGDDTLLRTIKNKDVNYTVKSFGFDDSNDLYCKKYETHENKIVFSCDINGVEETFIVPAIGEHNILNSMSAILVGLTLGLSISEIKEGLQSYTATKMRLELKRKDSLLVIDDCYNASPDSMISALKVLSRYESRKIAILGDIYEMGEYAESGHRKVGEASIGKADILLTIGSYSKYIADEAILKGFNKEKVIHFNSKKDCLCTLDEIIRDDDTVLVKASRGMGLEDIVNHILKI